MASSISLYADDVVLFCHPNKRDLTAIRVILWLSGLASGLHTNFAKCAASPIQCAPIDRTVITDNFDCLLKEFPTPYLRLPLSIRKVSASAL